jgi:hypothetical protein
MLSQDGQPRGRAEELIRVLRDLGFTTSADLIASDIFMRRREANLDPIVERSEPSGADGRPDRLVFESARDEGEASAPLEDEEVREVIREALEDTIIAPLRMLREVTELTQTLAATPRERISLREAIPLIQMEEDSDGVAWCDFTAFEHAQLLEGMMPQIMAWLSEPPTTESAP